MSVLAEHQADCVTEEQAVCPARVLMFSLSKSVAAAWVTLHGNRPFSSIHKVTAHCFDLEAWHLNFGLRLPPPKTQQQNDRGQNGSEITGFWEKISTVSAMLVPPDPGSDVSHWAPEHQLGKIVLMLGATVSMELMGHSEASEVTQLL